MKKHTNRWDFNIHIQWDEEHQMWQAKVQGSHPYALAFFYSEDIVDIAKSAQGFITYIEDTED